MHKATTHSAQDLVASFYSDVNTLWPKLVNSFRLPQEHNFELFSLRILVDVLAQSLVNGVSLSRDVEIKFVFVLNFHLFILNFHLLDLFQKLALHLFILNFHLFKFLKQIQLYSFRLIYILL